MEVARDPPPLGVGGLDEPRASAQARGCAQLGGQPLAVERERDDPAGLAHLAGRSSSVAS